MDIESALYGERPEIVLLHEGLGSVSTWGEFPQQLHAATGKGVYVFSRRGYGNSTRKPSPWDANYMHEEADWLGGHLDSIGFKSGFLIGHSDGASIAALYMGKMQDPRVQGLALIAPHFFVESLSLTSIEAAKTAFETTNLREKLARHHTHVDDVFWGWNGAWLSPQFAHWNIESSLATIPCKTLLLQGREDQYGTLSQIQTAKDLIAHTTTCILENCQHNPMKEQPAATLTALQVFLE